MLAVFALESSGIVSSAVVATAVGIGLSMAIARIGAWLWVRNSGSRDLVFGDLMLWGWLKRMRTESRLTNSVELLGLDRSGAKVKDVEISPQRQTEILRGLATALETGDPFTHGHTKRVTRYSYMLAKTMRLPQETVRKIRAAAAVHDVGKIETPSEILNKPGALTDEEFDIMKRHSAVGATMVEQLGDPEITAMVRHHHERMDGTGYPDKLPGEMIPLGARVIAVADTFDAIISSRPYRGARRHKDAIEILERVAGTQLDERAVYAFLSYYSGRKPLAWWLSFSAGVQRVVGGMGGWLQHAQGASQGAFSLAMAIGLATASVAIPGVADFGRKKAGSAKPLVAVEKASDHIYVSDVVGGYEIAPGPGAAAAGLASASTDPAREDADHLLAASGSGGALVGDPAPESAATDEVVADPSDVEAPAPTNDSTPAPTNEDKAPGTTPAPKDDKTPPKNPCDDVAARARDEEDDECDVDGDDTDGGDGGTDGTDGDDSDGTDGKEGDDSDTNVSGPTDGTDGDNSQATDPIDGDDSDSGAPTDGGTAPTGGADETDLTDGDNSAGTDDSADDDSDTNVSGPTDGTDGDNSHGTDPRDGDDSDTGAPTGGPDNSHTNNGSNGNHGEGNNGENGNHGEGNNGNEEPPGQVGNEPPGQDGNEPPGQDGNEPPGLVDNEPPGLDGNEPPGLDGNEPPGLDGNEPPGLVDDEPQPVVVEEDPVTEVVPPEEEQPLPEDLDGDPLPEENAVLPEVVVPEEIEVPVPPSGDE